MTNILPETDAVLTLLAAGELKNDRNHRLKSLSYFWLFQGYLRVVIHDKSYILALSILFVHYQYFFLLMMFFVISPVQFLTNLTLLP